MATVTMPQLGESVTEGTIVQWLKQPGEAVHIDDPLCEIETEKVTAELPSEYEGTMGEILVPQGDVAEVGAPLCEVVEAGATAQASQPGAGPRAQRWAERRAQRLEQLKAQLKLSPAQEGAWSAYTAAMQPPAQRPARMNHAELAQLSTPQRIERMQALQAEHQQFMSQRLDAVKAFYAQLTPEQQKIYDQQSLRHGPAGRGGMHGMRWH
jgi:pyruvate/2-oxoglutarate dehydrogenase complex dihydrolipoamide acyltransferase (E2) component